jgi:O-antigen/teichoic acid export membrane protein
MVDSRSGDEITLLDSSIRTTGGALISTALYVLSGLVYVFVTSAAATGTYFFITLSVALVLRPIRGISQTVQKLGSERGEAVSSYLGVALIFAVGYLLISGGLVFAVTDELLRRTVLTPGTLPSVGLYALALVVSMLVASLLGAIGYPSVETWLNGLQSAITLTVLLIFAPVLSSASDLLLVTAGVRLLLRVPVAVLLGVVPAVPSRHALRRAWNFGKWSVPDQILDRFSYNMPVYVLGVVATPAAVGIYETADRFADFGATISWRLSSPLLTKVSGDVSVGDDSLQYLDSAITAGTGATFVVFGYLLAAHDVVAGLVFADAQAAFSATVLIVGGVNLLRGFWTLTSHAIEGLGRPSVSFRTKLYGLLFSTPVPAVFGAEFGAMAGAVGYGIMNLVIFGYVSYYARDVLGRIPVDTRLAAHLFVGLFSSFVSATGVVAALRTVGLPSVAIAITAAAACLVGFAGVMLAISRPTRRATYRAVELCFDLVRSTPK